MSNISNESSMFEQCVVEVLDRSLSGAREQIEKLTKSTEIRKKVTYLNNISNYSLISKVWVIEV